MFLTANSFLRGDQVLRNVLLRVNFCDSCLFNIVYYFVTVISLCEC